MFLNTLFNNVLNKLLNYSTPFIKNLPKQLISSLGALTAQRLSLYVWYFILYCWLPRGKNLTFVQDLNVFSFQYIAPSLLKYLKLQW